MRECTFIQIVKNIITFMESCTSLPRYWISQAYNEETNYNKSWKCVMQNTSCERWSVDPYIKCTTLSFKDLFSIFFLYIPLKLPSCSPSIQYRRVASTYSSSLSSPLLNPPGFFCTSNFSQLNLDHLVLICCGYLTLTCWHKPGVELKLKSAM